MRLDELDLIKYGVFTDCHLDLSGPGVHLVIGANAAGKSTTRDAVADTLYGIPRRTGYGFLHDARDLRLAAVLRGADGARLALERWKKDRDALRTPDGAVLDPRRLETFLGGVSREQFVTTFAIDHRELRTGGAALLEGKGDLATALFETRSSARLTDVLTRLQAQSEALFVPRGQIRELNRALAGEGPLATARRRLHASLLRPEMYQAAVRAVEEHAKHKQQVTDDLGRARSERDRLTRIKQAYPAMAQRARILAECDKLLEAGPVIGPGAAGQFATARAARDKTRTAIEGLDETAADTTRTLEALNPSPTVLSQSEAIEQLHAEAKATANLERSAKQAREQAEALHAQIAESLTRIGAEKGATPAPPGPAVRAGMNLMVNAKHQLDADLKTARSHLTGRDKALTAQQAKLATLAEVPADPADLRAAIKAVPKELPGRLDAQRTQHRVLGQRLARALARTRLQLPDDLAAMALPADEHVADLRERHHSAQSALAGLQAQHAERTRARTAAQRKLAQLLKRNPPPNEQELTAARRERDHLWTDDLLPRLIDPAHPGAGPAPVARYEQTREASDEIADRMRREAARVAERTQLEDAVELATSEITDLEHDLDIAREQLAQHARAWERLWAEAALPTPGIDEGPDTLATARAIRELQDEHDQLQLALDADTALARAHAADLRTESARAQGPGAAADAALPRLLEIAEEHLAAMTETVKKRAAAHAKIEELTGESAGAADAVRTLQQDLDEWRQQWNAYLTEQHLSPGAAPDQVLAELAELDRIQTLGERAASEQARAARDQEQIDAYAARLDQVLRSLGRPIPDTLAQRSAAMAALKKLSDAALATEADQQRCETDLAALAKRREQLVTREAQHTTELALLAARHNIADEPGMIDAIERDKAHRVLTDQLATLEKGLAGTGVGLTQLEQEISDQDHDQIEAALTRIETGIYDLEAEQGRLGSELALLQQDVRAMNGSATAAGAADDVEHELAAIAQRTQEYLRLRLAEHILRESIETYRSQNQTPLLRRAESYFAQLTCGQYPQLLDDADAHGQPVLRARQDDRRIVEVEELSEGTRDQLYLALRLASLDQHIDAGRTMPLILDDIFMAFDDKRTTAGLRLLAELAPRLQVIVLTHHAHLEQLASRTLPAGGLHLHQI